MDKRATIINRFISIGIVVSLGLATFSILTKVRLYGDDWHYFQYATGGINYFFLRHYDHYLLANGRALVHLGDPVFGVANGVLANHKHFFCFICRNENYRFITQ